MLFNQAVEYYNIENMENMLAMIYDRLREDENIEVSDVEEVELPGEVYDNTVETLYDALDRWQDITYYWS